MIKAAIVGLGRWGQILVDSVEGKSEAIRFVAGATRTPAKAQGFMDAHGIPMAADYGAILKDPKVDAVVLATPHSQHADHVIAGAQAGKHVFVDKPFTLTKASAEVAVAATRKAGVVLALGHNRRFLPAYLELKKRLEAGALGSLFHVEANYSGAGAVDYTPQVWRGSPVESPAGGMAGSGIHMIDGMLGLFGRFRTTTARSLRQALTHDIDDTTFMTLHLRQRPHRLSGRLVGHSVHVAPAGVRLRRLDRTARRNPVRASAHGGRAGGDRVSLCRYSAGGTGSLCRRHRRQGGLSDSGRGRHPRGLGFRDHSPRRRQRRRGAGSVSVVRATGGRV